MLLIIGIIVIVLLLIYALSGPQEQQPREGYRYVEHKIPNAEKITDGTIYVISNLGSFGEDVYKIGLTRRDEPMDRVKELGDASVPFTFDVHALVDFEDAPSIEKHLHDKFDDYRVNKVNSRKEFFKMPLSLIKEELMALGLPEENFSEEHPATHWRETMRINKELEKLEQEV